MPKKQFSPGMSVSYTMKNNKTQKKCTDNLWAMTVSCRRLWGNGNGHYGSVQERKIEENWVVLSPMPIHREIYNLYIKGETGIQYENAEKQWEL